MHTLQMSSLGPLASEPLSTSQAARVLGVSVGTIRRFSDLGQLESSRTPSGSCRFSEGQLRAFLDALEPASSPLEPDLRMPEASRPV